MKKLATLMVLTVMTTLAVAQTPNDPIVEKLTDGYVRVSGVDALGADVAVLYDNELVKVYQERTANGETTYARFFDGTVVDTGVLTKPLSLNKAVEEAVRAER